MIPHPARGLADLAAKLTSAILPETSSRFAAANSGMIAMLLSALAQDTERAVDARMTDIDELRTLLTGVGAAATQAPGSAARTAFCERRPASLRLGDVDALHGEGMRLLIELHAWAEANDPALDRRIWDFLARHTERHRLDLG